MHAAVGRNGDLHEAGLASRDGVDLNGRRVSHDAAGDGTDGPQHGSSRRSRVDEEYFGGRLFVHIDPRRGIAHYGPADAADSKVRTIRTAIVGTQDAIEGVRSWLDQCREPIEAKRRYLTHFYVPFPGFDTQSGYRSTILSNSRLERRIDKRALSRLTGLTPGEAVTQAVAVCRRTDRAR